MTDPDVLASAVRAAVQAILDDSGDGYQVSQLVVCMGLERVSTVGELESSAWYWAPPSQPDWMTGGLIETAYWLRREADPDD